ncbi:hypothetical protein CI109_100850 [Kwoniella shandongensis]|uniref:Uncharacterized protein n=1 Tax=Kwoniella shandongensis TaxID=1734106 RepID=A0A5M6BWZ6_9TREE|nr:uncharacterized protein CI109_006102 [Kwoniella shandongensis]KAA5525529.1 hypothetical protein CI109_006102 [Kwoniella shandongensis]
MAGFSLHPVLPSLKARITAIHQHEDRLYIGLFTGSIQIYSYDVPSSTNTEIEGEDEDTTADAPLQPVVKLLKTHVHGRRQIDQIGVLGVTKQLVVLSDSIITVYPLPHLGKTGTSTLPQARSAHTFAITSYNSKGKNTDANDAIEGVRDLLVVGCRKKVVIYGAGKQGLKDPLELALPHSPRHIIFPSAASAVSTPPLPETIHLLFSPQTSVLLHLNPASTANRLTVTDLTTSPPPPVTSSTSATSGEEGGTGLTMGMGALSGLGGYVGLGSKAAIPVGTRTVGGEVLLAREDLGVFYSSEGNYTRQASLQWPGPPDGVAFANPYIYSIVPVVPTSSSSTASTAVPVPTLQVHLAPTLTLRQTLALPSPSTGGLTVTSLVTTSTAAPQSTPAANMLPSTKLLFVSTPTDKTLAATEGSTIWGVRADHIGHEVDELVRQGRIGDAIGLVEAVGESGLSPSRRLPHLQTLQAVTQIAHGQYQTAMETFLIHNVNPALVLSLFPADIISGKLHVPKDGWMELFGAVEGARLEPVTKEEHEGGVTRSLLKSVTGLRLGKKDSTDTASVKGDDAASVRSVDGEKAPPTMSGEEAVPPRAALEALMYFLSDRRQKLTGAITTTPLPAENSLPPLSTLSAEEQHNLPSIPMNELDPEQLLRMAQVIYTGLIKVYLVARPILVGSLCRIENWCDVEEVEELLKAQKKFGDLIDLYQGKKMHSKALRMLHELAKDEEDKLDRYPPTIRYLQKLGPAELPLILESSKWIFEEDPRTAIQIFTADEAEVEALPRQEVTDFLEQTDEESCIGYLEHVITTLGEEGSAFHDKLVELYLARVRRTARSEDDEGRQEAYDTLLTFLSTSTQYRPYRIVTRLTGDELPEARAILLGRMGKHEEALRIYVYKLEDYIAAEAYCVRNYSDNPQIFLLLLQIYLRPVPSTVAGQTSTPPSKSLLAPALSLISKHSTSLPPSPVLDLLPPLVPMSDVQAFFTRTLRDDHSKMNEKRVVRNIVKGRKEEVERILLGLEVKRVRVTDQRICPQCHKRLGQSAIAVHAPRGEVTHLHCKDPFSAKLAKLRG